MNILRGILFQLAFVIWTLMIGIAGLPLLLGPPRWTHSVARLWCGVTMTLLRTICGLHSEARGKPPEGPCILAVQHQSTWETLFLPLLLHEPVFVLKRELLWVPVVGLHLRKLRSIAIDRGAATRALKKMLREAKLVRETGRPLVIFPEGTRVAPPRTGEFNVGVAALYVSLKLPVVPVALNSGYFWGRHHVAKHPGNAVIQFLEPIEPGLSRDDFMALLHQRIDTTSLALADEVPSGLRRVEVTS